MLTRLIGGLSGLQVYLVGGLAAAVFLLGAGLTVQTHRLHAEMNARATDRGTYELAINQTEANALAYKVKKEKEYADKATEANTNLANLTSKYHAAVLRYQASQHHGRPASGEKLSTIAGTPESGNGLGDDSLLYITQSDALICADKTARLEVIHEWGLHLRDENWVEPDTP